MVSKAIVAKHGRAHLTVLEHEGALLLQQRDLLRGVFLVLILHRAWRLSRLRRLLALFRRGGTHGRRTTHAGDGRERGTCECEHGVPVGWGWAEIQCVGLF